jgi:hypothetical protein
MCNAGQPDGQARHRSPMACGPQPGAVSAPRACGRRTARCRPASTLITPCLTRTGKRSGGRGAGALHVRLMTVEYRAAAGAEEAPERGEGPVVGRAVVCGAADVRYAAEAAAAWAKVAPDDAQPNLAGHDAAVSVRYRVHAR